MTNPMKTLFATGLGAAAMYYLDPARRPLPARAGA